MFNDSVAQRRAIKPRLVKLFPNFRTGGDFYRTAIRAALKPSLTVLDAGCGASGIITEFRPDIERLIGVDVDRGALYQNKYLDERLPNDLAAISKPDGSVDLIVGEFVLEHLKNPRAVLSELWRVLKPGGSMIWLTPNTRHPVMALSRLTPRAWHDWWKRETLKRTDQVHRAYYRANTPRAITALADQAGLTVAKIDLAGNPEYLAITESLITPAIKLEKYLAEHHPTRQMYMVVTMVKK